MTSLTARLPGVPRLDPVVLGSVGALALLGLGAILYGNGNLGIAVAPLLIVLVLLAVSYVPLRHSLMVLAFLALTLENPSEAFAMRLWESPLHVAGALLLGQLKHSLGISVLVVSGMDLFLFLILMVWLVRRMRGSQADAGGQVATAGPLAWAGFGALATIALMWGFGIARGGSFDNSLWQIFRVIYLPFVFLLFAAALRGGRDAPRLAALLIAAAVYRALLAIYVRSLFPDLELMPHTTTHADSMLFANACVLVLAIVYERPGRRSAWLALGVLPVLVWGMIANNRRLVWVELLGALVVLAVITGWSPIKRRIMQAFILSLPLLLVYVGVGWGRPTGVFAPVRTLRSMVDSESDSSTRWRDWENYNLYSTLRHAPVLGTGFGHGYEEVVQLPDISAHYALYRLAPHNSILGIFAYGGAVGFAGLFMLIPLGVYFAVRSYRRAIAARDRIAALTAIGTFVTYLMHCYGDMGLGTMTSVFTLGAALALVGKIAVATGAWPVGSLPRP